MSPKTKKFLAEQFTRPLENSAAVYPMVQPFLDAKARWEQASAEKAAAIARNREKALVVYMQFKHSTGGFVTKMGDLSEAASSDGIGHWFNFLLVRDGEEDGLQGCIRLRADGTAGLSANGAQYSYETWDIPAILRACAGILYPLNGVKF